MLVGGIGAGLISGCSSDGDSQDGDSTFTGGGGNDSPPPLEDRDFATPLVVPATLTPLATAAAADADAYHLTIKPGTAQMKPGRATPIVGFNGIFPGPTIIATRGRPTQVTQTNAWNERVTVHNHGHKVAAESDGHPVDYITPGTSKVYTYPNDQPGGTFWYHDHTMDVTGRHVYGGLAGFYIIHDPAEDALNLPSGAYDVPLLLQDKTFNANNTTVFDERAIGAGFHGDTAVVNGVVNPFHEVATRKYRFRLLNGANAREWQLRFLVAGSSTPLPFKVIASDGGLLAAPVNTTTLSMAPGERYDIVVDFANIPVNTRVTMANTASSQSRDDDDRRGGGGGGGGRGRDIPSLMQFVVARQEADTSTVPAKLANITRYKETDAKSRANVSLSFNNGDWGMNGRSYDPGRIDLTSKLDTVTIWTLKNDSGLMHPFHKHLVEFNVLDINGQPPPPEMRGLKDTVAVPGRGTARIIFKNEGFTGTYVFHCHKLEHEDHRMMLQEGVTR
ncbi:multicopper oxidase domain-containing protein [Pendulispora rubella]|uniref:Multicopper oxidase domain-containing protein n=1 Tax=Pendulispora rubella TaxID=2741070 RepID=A0ABZ2LLW8_9BACT